MVRFAHISDTHLGKRQYKLLAREEDFYRVFCRIVDRVIDEGVDFVVHSGDVFNSSNPSPRSLVVFQEGLLRLSRAGIPLFCIAGNHDILLREGSVPPLDVFKENGLCVIDDKNPFYVYDGVFIGGVCYHTRSRSEEFYEQLEILSSVAEDYSRRVLLLHQGFDEDLRGWEFESEYLPVNFDYYGMGHVHSFKRRAFGRGLLVYPGSSEVSREDENRDKSFCIVEITDNGGVDVERVMIDLPRKFVERTLYYDRLDVQIPNLQSELWCCDYKPILDLTIVGRYKPDNLFSLLNDSLGYYCIRLNYRFEFSGRNSSDVSSYGGSLGVHELLFSRVSEEFNTEIGDFAVKLYDNLSQNNMEVSGELLDEVYQLYLKEE